MAETAFGVTYGGTALANGRMPVRDLAPALLALGELFTEASTLVYPDRDPVALDIQANTEGSFIVDLILQSPRGWDTVRDLFSSDDVTALVNLQNLVLGSGGLFALIKFLRGQRPPATEDTPHPGHVRITQPDGTVIEVPTDVLRLYNNVPIRKAAREVVEPLARPGVERVEFRPDKDVTIIVAELELAAFEPPPPEQTPLLDQETEMVVSIVSVTFREGNKWRFSDGERVFHAAIEDEAFLARVSRGTERFGNGDMLRCRMRIVQTKSEQEGLRTEYHLIEVLEHLPRTPHPQFWPDDEPKMPPELR